MQDEIMTNYVEKIIPILPLAKKAYGSRNIKSPQHDASREYTRLLVEYYEKGGSLLKIAKALGVTYAGVRRRVLTSTISVSPRQAKSKATEAEVAASVERLEIAKTYGVEIYHSALQFEYEVNGISLTKIAKAMGLSSANPLYYGVAKTKLKPAETE